jgi:hypothetical protein
LLNRFIGLLVVNSKEKLLFRYQYQSRLVGFFGREGLCKKSLPSLREGRIWKSGQKFGQKLKFVVSKIGVYYPLISNRGRLLLGHKIQQQIEWRSNHSNKPSFLALLSSSEPSLEYSIAAE